MFWGDWFIVRQVLSGEFGSPKKEGGGEEGEHRILVDRDSGWVERAWTNGRGREPDPNALAHSTAGTRNTTRNEDTGSFSPAI